MTSEENRNKVKKNIDLHVFVLSSSQTEKNANVLQLGCCGSHELCKTKEMSILGIMFLLVQFTPSLEPPMEILSHNSPLPGLYSTQRDSYSHSIAVDNSDFYCIFFFILRDCLDQLMQRLFCDVFRVAL